MKTKSRKLLLILLPFLLLFFIVMIGLSIHNATFAYTPASAEAMRGSDCASVESDLNGAGFQNVIVKKTLDGKAEDGAVVRVAINGKAAFHREEKFRKDSEVIITYYEKPASMPLGYDDFIDMPYTEAVKKLKAAGFDDVAAEAVRDNQGDGETVTEVSVGGKSAFAAGDEFSRHDPVVVSYHALRIAVPFSSEEANKLKYNDAVAKLNEAGFELVETKAVAKGEGTNGYVAWISIDGKTDFEKDGKSYKDVNVVVGYWDLPFTISVHVNFVANLIFSKYDVDVLVDGVYQDTLAHGQDADLAFNLKEGPHTLTFENTGSSSVKGEVKLNVKSDAAAAYTIYCFSDKVTVESKANEVKAVDLTKAAATTKAPAATKAAAATTAKAAAATTTKAAPLVVSARKLVDDLESNAYNAKSTYLNKYVQVKGQVSGIDANGKYFNIDPVGDHWNFTDISCFLAKDKRSMAASLSKGKEVTVVGTITLVGEILGYSIQVESIR